MLLLKAWYGHNFCNHHGERLKQAFLEGQDWPCAYLADAGTAFDCCYYDHFGESIVRSSHQTADFV